MRKTNNYYKPKVEELHVGLKVTKHKTDEESNKSWFEDCVLDLDSLNFERDYRVKMLDWDDVESLGWKSVEGKNNEFEWSKPVQDLCDTEIQYNLVKLYADYNKRLIAIEAWEEQEYHGEDACIFRGIIKNKSELERLMNQLGIEPCERINTPLTNK